MSISSPPSPEDKLKFTNSEQIGTRVESLLKHRYGRGIYIHDSYETTDGDLVLSLGNSIPRNLSDRKEQDRVLKFVNIRDIYTLRAVKTEGHYLIELPDRDDIYNSFVGRREEILDQMDWSMAKAIYENVFDLPPVRNQLNSILQILRWTGEEPGISVARISDIQRSSRSREYLEVLEELDFLRIEDGNVYAGKKLQEADLRRKSTDEFVKAAIGNVIQEGYHVLRERLDLRMLSHYPKYANAYYYDAIQRGSSDLWLDIDAIAENLEDKWQDRKDPLVIDEKLRDLARAGVLKKDGEFVQANPEVYQRVSQETPLA
jgi:hypothetical protein